MENNLARIAGINLPTNKRVIIALTYIHGIGNTASQEICKSVGIEETKRINEISDSEVMSIREYIESNLMVEGDLRREKSMNIKRLMDLVGLMEEKCWQMYLQKRNLMKVIQEKK